MKNFKTWNIILAWLTFAIATYTYLSTLEPSVSFWDCGEFIAAADKLMITHPPGSPLFLMAARVFSMMAPSPDKVALMVNALSGLCSAFTILFLFWTITHLAKRLMVGEGTMTKIQAYAILGSGLVGALAYTFTDSFWFSAVEGELYAMSSLFTAVVFWAILRWEEEANAPYSMRWIVLIGYLLGLSIGVHLLNLLAIPAIALVYYFRTTTVFSYKNTIYVLIGSAGLLAFVMYGVIPGTVKLAAVFDLLFVNTLSLPYNSGMLFSFILILGLLSLGILYSQKKNQKVINLACSFFLLMFLGYSSYAMVVIRSNAKPSMNQNGPDDAYSLLSYLNREQYGDNPLFYGQYYNSPVVDRVEGTPYRDQINGKYETVGQRYEPVYDAATMSVFPRMWSSQAQHIAEYKRWAEIKGKKVKASNGEVIAKPTFTENLRYLFRYQLGHMYVRYFMWNFVGRQNDQPGHGSAFRGNWISGIPVIDKILIGGDQKLLPDAQRNDKSRNTYFFLPLLLGVAGIVYQLKNKSKRGNESFLVVAILFVMTGVAIVIYLNQYPLQPRERDYAYAASFYAFAIWIGMGVLMLTDLFAKAIKKPTAAIVSTLIALAIPVVLAQQNWDDHKRSDRYVARDTAYNYLMSCAPNAILFTFADNDTFPIWYLQEVEGVRTDVKVCNLTYLSTDWYINTMRKAMKDAEPIDFFLEHEQTRLAQNNYVYLLDYSSKPVPVKSALAWLKSDHPKTKMVNGQAIPHLPSKQFTIAVDKEKLIGQGKVSAQDTAQIVDALQIDYSTQHGIYKNNLMALDLLMSNDWQRPVYYATSVSSQVHFGLEKYFQLCGSAYQVLPVEKRGAINTDLMYDNLMHKYRYGNVKNANVYLDNDTRKQAAIYRMNFVHLAKALHQEGITDKAREVMNRCLAEVPSASLAYGYAPPYKNDFPVVDTLLKLGMKEEAIPIIAEMHQRSKQEMDYLLSFDYQNKPDIQEMLRHRLSAYYQLMNMSKVCPAAQKAEIKKEFEKYYGVLGVVLKG